MNSILFQAALLGLSVFGGSFPETEPPKKPEGAIADAYRATVDRIVSSAMTGNNAYERLEHLCVKFGHRLSGSKELERVIDWSLELMRKDGLVNVRREKVMVPHWERGEESATLVEPRVERMRMLGLGGSVATPPEGVTAPVIVVADEEELNRVADAVAGKIVLFNKVMPPYDPDKGSGYGETVKYRTKGASLAAAKGAVGCLVRSVTARSLRSPHTGAMRYEDGVSKIPAAAISVEDADTLARLQERGEKIVVNLKMSAKTLPDAESGNAVGELRGSIWPEQVVVLGGHIDAWDVGHGAHDDGGGCIAAIEAVALLKRLNLNPKRTIRVVLWTNEENGLAGGKAYAKDHEAELANHVAAIETDSGSFRPKGYSLECENKDRASIALDQLHQIVGLLTDAIGPMNVDLGGSGADISPMKPAGVVLMGHGVEGSTYFDYHHSEADTIDKVNPTELSQNVAVLAAVAYVIADLPERFGERAAEGTK